MPPVIDVKNLTKQYVSYRRRSGAWRFFQKEKVVRQAVTDISFSVNRGEIVGFIGPNGAGKTTTLKMLSGILHPTSGQATVLGFVPWERPVAYRKRFSIIMGQRNQLWWELPALETFKLNQVIYAIPEDVFRERLDELVKLLDVVHVLDVPVRNLSLGERMKCEIIASLLHQPEVLFLDEPTIGLDIVSQKTIRQFFKDYSTRYHVTILLTSHYMQDVEALCERVIVIDHGGLLYDGSVAALKEKYAEEKEIHLSFEEIVDRARLETYGRVVEYDGMRAVFRLPQHEAKQQASRILNELPVADITIKEESLESVITSLFLDKKK